MIDVLRVFARQLIEEGYDADDVLKKVSRYDIDFLSVQEELSASEASKRIDDAELDTIKVLLAYILMKDTELELEEIYAFIFGTGKQIVWH